MTMKTIKLAFDGKEEECLVTEAADGEITCYTRDRRFVKFPPKTDLVKAAKKHNDANATKPISAADADAQEAEKEAWFD